MSEERVLIIRTCKECPYRGAENNPRAKIQLKPYCELTHKELPYTEFQSGGETVAIGLDSIPKWCPLDSK